MEAVKQLNNHRLGKLHTFAMNLFTDFGKYENIPAEWEPYKVASDFYTYLLESDVHAQFCIVAETLPNSVQIQL